MGDLLVAFNDDFTSIGLRPWVIRLTLGLLEALITPLFDRLDMGRPASVDFLDGALET